MFGSNPFNKNWANNEQVQEARNIDTKKMAAYQKFAKANKIDDDSVRMAVDNPNHPETKRMMTNKNFAKAVSMYKSTSEDSHNTSATQGKMMTSNAPEVKKNEKKRQTEALDPVNKNAVKKKFDDRKDKDIDNDGDVDSSDKFLHKKRKAISKNIKKGAKNGGKEGDVEMNPKMEKETTQKESRIRSALKSVLERKGNHSPNQDKAEKIKDARKGKGAEDMMAAADAEIAKGPDAHLNEPEIDKKNFEKMTSNVKVAGKRKGDNPKGDTNIKPAGTPIKDPAAVKAESYDKMSGLKAAYASMYAEKVEEDIQEAEQLDELSPDLLHRAADKQTTRTTRIGSLASKQTAAGRNSNKADKMYDKSKARQDRFRKAANAAGDRDAEKKYQASKGK